MKKITLTTTFTIYDSIDELTETECNLMTKAIDSRKLAYAPYSNFNVGAALLLENGIYVVGNNQENAAYPSGMCAERVAIWSASSRYPTLKVLKIAISASSLLHKVTKPVGPCGACRQAIAEYEIKQDKDIEILFMGDSGKIIKSNSLNDLLPLAFDKSYL